MSTKTVTIAKDGSLTVFKSDDDAAATPPAPPGSEVGAPMVIREHHRGIDGGSFTAGLMMGLLLFFIIQTAMRSHARREARANALAASIGPQEDRMAAEVAALSRRTATLETIVTDPAQRTAREIEALR